MLVGLLLSDAWLQSTNSNIKTPRIGLKQSIVNLPFLLSIYSELGYLCSTKVMCHISKIRGVAYTSFSFQTRALPCFIELYDLFIGPEKVKRISPELYDYLDYKALAFWIMGDGSKRNEGIILCTDNFTVEEVVLLMNMLMLKFNVNPTIHKEKSVHPTSKEVSYKHRIYLGINDLNKIRPFIAPHMHPHFNYKIDRI
jgi:hypothetical protein